LRRDLVQGQTSSIAHGRVDFGALTDSGEFAFHNGAYVYLFDGSIHPLTGVVTSVGPLVYDGVNIVYMRAGTSAIALVLNDKTSETILIPNTTQAPEFRAAGGWVSYTNSAGGARQVFVRSPEGVVKQASIWGSNSSICALNPDGAVLVNNGSPAGKRYSVLPGAAPQFVSSALGKCVYRNGAWYVKLGRSLFEVTGSGPVDAGSSQDAASDAGNDASLDGGSEPPDAGTGGAAGSSSGGSSGSGAASSTGGTGGAGTGGTGGTGIGGTGTVGAGGMSGTAGASAAGRSGASGSSTIRDGGVTAGASSNPGAPGSDDSGCSGCSVPRRSGAVPALVMLFAALWRARSRRRA